MTSGGGGGGETDKGPDAERSNNSAGFEQQQEEEDGGDESEEAEVTAFHDLIAGGVAGSASVIVGHPFDTIKVRLQTSSSANTSISSVVGSGFGGLSSLFRGMAAPLSCAAVINAIIFSSFGEASRVWDDYFSPEDYDPNNPIIIPKGDDELLPSLSSSSSSTPHRHRDPSLERRQTKIKKKTKQHHEPNEKGITHHHPDHPEHQAWKKAFLCGAFAGLVQCLVICPMEHIKCRLQIQHSRGSADALYRGSADAAGKIYERHGLRGLYRGWWCTVLRELPAFGLYFSSYDHIKDRINRAFVRDPGVGRGGDDANCVAYPHHTHTWTASAIAGGISGSLTWAVVYPVDVVKSRIQTMPLNNRGNATSIRMYDVAQTMIRKYGWRYMFRGLGVTLLRAFPVNGIIFPVYEFTLMQISSGDELNLWNPNHGQI